MITLRASAFSFMLMAAMVRGQTAQEDVTWAKGLAGLLHGQANTVVMELGSNRPPLDATPVLTGVQRMRAIALITGTRWSQARGVQVFERSPLPGEAIGVRDTERGVAWLASLSADEARVLAGDGMRIQDMSEQGQRFAAQLTSIMVPGMLPLFLSEPNNVEVSLTIQPTVVFTGPNGKEKTVPIFTRRSSPDNGIPFAPLDGPKLRSEPIQVDAPPTGPLDFGDGQIRTLPEILDMAREAFGRRFSYNHKLREAKFFIRGKFDEPALLESLRLVAVASPPERAISAQEARAILKRALEAGLAPLLEAASRNDPAVKGAAELYGKDSTTVKDALKLVPSMESYLKGFGLSPGDKLQFRFGIMIEINAAGFSELPGSSSTIGGKPAGGVTVRNNVRFVIAP